ncbi:ATP-binding protein [Frankia sp. QA3]|uniref:ATP-binding protein n=1 Tax=Frankia sp. QA3 TaxID=710111 RepID=UPI001E62DFC1|nr:ATP-binding protein [Frankia sp. QA3]
MTDPSSPAARHATMSGRYLAGLAARLADRHRKETAVVAVARGHADQLRAQLAQRDTQLAECQLQLGRLQERIGGLAADLAQRDQRVAEQAETIGQLGKRLEVAEQALGFISHEALPALIEGTHTPALPAALDGNADIVARYDGIAGQIIELRDALRQAQEALRIGERRIVAWEEGVRFVTDHQLPALAAGDLVPALPDAAGDEAIVGVLDRIGAVVAKLVEQAHDRFRDREEALRAATVGLARNVQAVSHRVQEEATAMVLAHPTTPDVLESGYRVDHAAAQQARYAQNLAVLCGESPGQQWQEPVAVADIVTAAASRIIAYQRVHASGDPDTAVVAHVAEPLISVIAELLANAAQSSPSTTEVLVGIRSVQRGVVYEIDDCGVGMEEFRLNRAREIASGRRPVRVADLGQTPQTGLAVVGEYVRRHGLRVDLSESVYGGVRAVVFVPDELTELLNPATRLARNRHRTGSPAVGTPPAPDAVSPPDPASAPSGDPASAVGKDRPSKPVLPQRRSPRHAALAEKVPPPATPSASPPAPPPSADEAGSFLAAILSVSPDAASGGEVTDPGDCTPPSAPLTPAEDTE